MKKQWFSTLVALMLLALGLAGPAARAAEAGKNAPNPWPAAADIDPFMGDYDGTWHVADDGFMPAYARIIARGSGDYQVVLYVGGYPNADEKTRIEGSGQVSGGQLQFTAKALNGPRNERWQGTVVKGQLTAANDGHDEFAFKRIERQSPTLGAKPPKGAAILMPYEPGQPTTLDAWTNPKWKILSDGSVQVTHEDLMSKQKFGDAQVHVEFCLPFMPLESGQGRANSGVYLQNRYEVQVLDSFGLVERDDDCGGIYHNAAPLLNAEYPPLAWQTYDIIIRAARFDADCDTTDLPLFTVYLNGVLIQKSVVVPSPTPGSAPGNTKRGELRLQDHLNPVRYRNVWVLERGDIPYKGGTELAPLVK